MKAVAFRPDGAIIATGAFDGGVTLWDVATSQSLAPPFRVHQEAVSSLSFSPDGKSLASGSADLSLVRWTLDIDSWRELACIAAHRNLTEVEWLRYVGKEPRRPICPESPAPAAPALPSAEQAGPSREEK